MVSIRHPKLERPFHLSSSAGADIPAEFPVHLLPPAMAVAVTAAAARTQAPLSLIAHHVLTLGAMAAQRLVDVRLPTGQRRPVSCCFVTAASAAERREAAAALTVGAVRAWEAGFDKEQSARAAAAAVAAGKGHLAGLGVTRLALFLDPKAAAVPDRYHGFARASGLFARHPEDVLRAGPSRPREAASLGRLWDGAVIARALQSPAHPRLSLHLVGTPREIRAVFGDAALTDNGFAARMLFCRPASTVGARAWSAAEDDAPPPDLARFLASLAALYSTSSISEPRELAFAPPAADAWLAYAREVESCMREGEAFASIRASAGLLAEHAARLAAVFAVIEDAAASEIGTAALERGIGFARFYAAEALRMFDFAPPQIARAEKAESLKAWLLRRPGEKLRLRDICTFGPPVVRGAGTAYAVMRDLERAGVVEPANTETKAEDKGRRPRVPYQWRVVPENEPAAHHDAA